MTPSLNWSLRAYERLLLLYPENLRRDFAPDMLEAFAEDLGAARGTAGALRLWRGVLREVLHIAVPAWFEMPAVVVPVLSAVLVVASQSPLMVRAARLQPTGPTDLADALVAVGIEAVVSALTSFVAIYRWKRARLVTLRIG